MKISRKTYQAILSVSIFFGSAPALADTAFSAVCEVDSGHGYSNSTELLGNFTQESWETDERFKGKRHFVYTGGDEMVIDGKKAYVLARHPGVLIVSAPDSNGISSSVWSYAIHFGVQKIVAAHVNADGLINSPVQMVRTSAISMKCDFNIS